MCLDLRRTFVRQDPHRAQWVIPGLPEKRRPWASRPHGVPGGKHHRQAWDGSGRLPGIFLPKHVRQDDDVRDDGLWVRPLTRSTFAMVVRKPDSGWAEETISRSQLFWTKTFPEMGPSLTALCSTKVAVLHPGSKKPCAGCEQSPVSGDLQSKPRWASKPSHPEAKKSWWVDSNGALEERCGQCFVKQHVVYKYK